MKFKDFIKWCNDRASDGCWDFISATCCINIIEKVRKEKWWRRDKYWKENYERDVLEDIIIPINEKRKTRLGR